MQISWVSVQRALKLVAIALYLFSSTQSWLQPALQTFAVILSDGILTDTAVIIVIAKQKNYFHFSNRRF